MSQPIPDRQLNEHTMSAPPIRRYEALAAAAANHALWLRAMFEIYYSYGWRLNELREMPARMLDFEHRTIMIETSKNGEPRTVKMTQKVFELLKACCAGKGENDYVFTRENGKPVKTFVARGRA